MEQNHLTVFSSKGCAGCNAVIQHFERLNIRHKVVKIDEDGQGMHAFRTLGHRTVPQIYNENIELLGSSLMDILKLPTGTLDFYKAA